MKKLLISSRDVGAALHLIEVYREASKRQSVDCHYVAQSPASEVLESAGLQFTPFDGPTVQNLNSDETETLLSMAQDVLVKVQPDIVLVGLSGINAGLDEALLRVASGKVPTFAFQDSWGDVNKHLETVADSYFVLDQLASDLTLQRGGKNPIIVGAPKYKSYSEYNLTKQKNESHLIGFFGQPIHHLDGYRETFRDLIQIISEIEKEQDCEIRFFYRPHPRETDDEKEYFQSLLKKLGSFHSAPPEGTIEEALIACDTVISCFSTVCYDFAMLQHYADTPLGTALYLLYEEDLQAHHRDISSLELPPPAEQGQAIAVVKKDDLKTEIVKSLTEEEAMSQWQQSKKITSPDEASKTIVDHVIKIAQQINTESSL